MYTPGPGAYRAWEAHEDAVRPQNLKSSSSNIFKTRVPRLESDRADFSKSPGPGSYNLMQEWIKPKHSYNRYNVQQPLSPEGTSETRLIFRKRATAPSVPARNQSYGYEETSAGDLIMQSAPKVGFTGIKEDTVGPGRYRPALKQQNRFTDFSRSTTTRKLFSTNNNPGPGQYTEQIMATSSQDGHTTQTSSAGATTRTARTGVTSAPAIPSSNFASKVKKLAENQAEKERIPGPGAYNAGDANIRATTT